MKRLIAVLLFVSVIGLLACSKSRHEDSEYPFIYLNDCLNKTYSGENVELCFTSLVTDSRCPINVQCVWGGVAIVNFKFTTKNGEYFLTLASTKPTPIYPPYSKDTIVDGYKIKFINLYPAPVHGKTTRKSEIKAEVEISK